jgi:hypothetical protein
MLKLIGLLSLLIKEENKEDLLLLERKIEVLGKKVLMIIRIDLLKEQIGKEEMLLFLEDIVKVLFNHIFRNFRCFILL